MRNGIEKLHIAVFLALCVLFTFNSVSAKAADTGATYQVNSEDATLTSSTLTYVLNGSAPISEFVAERFSPFRVVMDINKADFTFTPAALPANDFVKMEVEELKGDNAPGKRFIFALKASHDYEVSAQDNSVKIIFKPIKSDAAGKTGVTGTSLTSIDVVSSSTKTKFIINANKQIDDYKIGTLTGENKPPRMYIDIPQVDISRMNREKLVDNSSVNRVRVIPEGDGARLIFRSNYPQLFKYDVASTADGLEIAVEESRTVAPVPAQPFPPSIPAAAAVPQNKKDSNLDKLISSSEKKVSGNPDDVLTERAHSRIAALSGADFGNAGYDAQRITVDFYKVDIHNVFRLLREITDLNIIVDEHVQGSLTLALNDVPWDFALDIILNLMHLKKEERFNTIVIYPADQTFTWPGNNSSTAAANTLSIKPDLEIIRQQENQLVIEDNRQQSAEILKAKQLLQQAQLLEKQDNLEDAVVLLAEAARLWPQNTKITNRLAAICLVNLGQNAQAAHYADLSLKQNPKDNSAALYAAIANANMKRLSLANEYFIRSISSNPPMKEALLSYAAFSENNGMNDAALKLLKKYKKYYGENLNTMIASARIHEKQGKTTLASAEYRSILASGYQLSPDLRHYIRVRLSEK
jgi:type IV pilus assembly protein PilQ